MILARERERQRGTSMSSTDIQSGISAAVASLELGDCVSKVNGGGRWVARPMHDLGDQMARQGQWADVACSRPQGHGDWQT